NRKLFYSGSPGLKATSRTLKLYEQSNKCRFYLPCPHCDHMQPLLWENFRWDKAESGTHLAHTAHFECVSCHQKIEEKDKEEMLQGGLWIAERPEQTRPAGFWIWAAYARSWAEIVFDWITAETLGEEAKKAFVNTVRAEAWEEKYDAPSWEIIKQRAEP